MNLFRNRFLAWVTPGAGAAFLVLVAAYLVSVLGSVTHWYDLPAWLALLGPKFFTGQVWRLVTYACLSPGLGMLIGNGLGLIFLGYILEKFWSRGDFLWYCAVTAAGAGLAYAFLHASGGFPLMGPAPVIFALLMAVAFVRGREVVQLPPLTGMLTWHLVAVVAGINLLSTVFSRGWEPALVMLAAAVTGYIYLSLRFRWLMSRDSRVVESERMNRLEL